MSVRLVSDAKPRNPLPQSGMPLTFWRQEQSCPAPIAGTMNKNPSMHTEKERGLLKVPTNYYQQFDANYHLDVPAESYGGWKKEELELSLDHTAVVIMHAWDCGTREQYPGLHRACENLPRSYEIARTVFPTLLTAVRSSGSYNSPLRCFGTIALRCTPEGHKEGVPFRAGRSAWFCALG